MTADTPVPRQLSEEERALWEKAQALKAALTGCEPFTLTAYPPHLRHPSGLDANQRAAVEAWEPFLSAANPAVILSLLTALSSEREAGELDKARLDWLGEIRAPYLNRDLVDLWDGQWSHVNPEENEAVSRHASIREAIDAARHAPKCEHGIDPRHEHCGECEGDPR